MQTSPVGTFPTTLRAAAPKIYAAEGLNGFYKSLVPLWGRQIPYTMMKFACFEKTVEALYAYVVPKPRSECSKAEQLVVTFAAGYIAGGNYPQNMKRRVLTLVFHAKNIIPFWIFYQFTNNVFSTYSILCYRFTSR